MAHKYVNRAWMTTATTGTGTVTLGSAKAGEYYAFAEAGMSDGDTADYVILDGSNVEMGVGTYTSSGTTFSRDTVTSSRISGTAGTSKISLSGSATIFLTSSASEAQAVYDKLLSLAANSVLARADTSAGAVSGVALAASQLLGRGSTGNVAAIALGTGLSMSGATMNAASSGAPSGSIVDYAGATEPSGWLFCYGQAISRTTYADLFAAISTTYGVGDGSTTFNVPDLRGRVVAGQDDMGGTSANRLTNASGGVDGDTLGATGGAETHTLILDEIPAHNHAITTGGTDGGTSVIDSASGSAGSKYTSLSGNDGAHNNVQPTIILNKIIKT